MELRVVLVVEDAAVRLRPPCDGEPTQVLGRLPVHDTLARAEGAAHDLEVALEAASRHQKMQFLDGGVPPHGQDGDVRDEAGLARLVAVHLLLPLRHAHPRVDEGALHAVPPLDHVAERDGVGAVVAVDGAALLVVRRHEGGVLVDQRLVLEDASHVVGGEVTEPATDGARVQPAEHDSLGRDRREPAVCNGWHHAVLDRAPSVVPHRGAAVRGCCQATHYGAPRAVQVEQVLGWPGAAIVGLVHDDEVRRELRTPVPCEQRLERGHDDRGVRAGVLVSLLHLDVSEPVLLDALGDLPAQHHARVDHQRPAVTLGQHGGDQRFACPGGEFPECDPVRAHGTMQRLDGVLLVVTRLRPGVDEQGASRVLHHAASVARRRRSEAYIRWSRSFR